MCRGAMHGFFFLSASDTLFRLGSLGCVCGVGVRAVVGGGVGWGWYSCILSCREECSHNYKIDEVMSGRCSNTDKEN